MKMERTFDNVDKYQRCSLYANWTNKQLSKWVQNILTEYNIQQIFIILPNISTHTPGYLNQPSQPVAGSGPCSLFTIIVNGFTLTQTSWFYYKIVCCLISFIALLHPNTNACSSNSILIQLKQYLQIYS